MLQKPVIKKPSTTLRVGELRFIMLLGPRGVNTLSSEPQTKGLQSFYTWTGTIEQVYRGWVIAKNRTRMSEISSSS